MFLVILLLATANFASSSKHPDEVETLPGLNFTLNFKHYSGYLNATEGKFLHYWFVESQRSPSTDPVVLWLNGGPGCSSLDGFLTENGPLLISSDGRTLYNNTFSWNREANVIFLESPAGVGFSYSLNKRYATDDDRVSLDNYLVLQRFFEKFPQFQNNDFYIVGESYAGVYVPTLAVRVLDGPDKINLKGYAIGNGYLDFENYTTSLMFFAYYHGLVAPTLWKQVTDHCCEGGVAVPEKCNFSSPNPMCIFYAYRILMTVLHSDLNMYNLYSKCDYSSEKGSKYSVDRRNLLQRLTKTFRFSLQLGHTPPCLDTTAITKYLNQPEVRKALHVPESVQDWDICSDDVEYSYKKLHDTMRPEIMQLAKAGVRGLIYNGDVDMACNFLSDMWFVESLGLKKRYEYSPWRYNNQIAGFVKYYDNLTFMTIKGSGHMVPEDKPAEAFHMISKFLKNKWF